MIKCPGCDIEVNYTDAILRDVLTKGIADPEIQLDLLGDKNLDMTLEEVFKFVEAKESGKRSASKLLDTHSVDAASSAYRKSKSDKPFLIIMIMKKSIFFQFRIKLLKGPYISIKVLIELTAHFCYAIQVYWRWH